jgi:hypothetical protein
MSLINLWRTNPETVLGMTLPTVVRMAIDPDNSLKDGSLGSVAFRQFLTEIDSKKLASYATYCLENAFTDSGQVLQDIVNEVGRRLGFMAQNGRYRGVKNDIGYDGIWTANGQSLVVEVKTTDAYTIRLDTVATYRDRLIEESRIPKNTPILIVIGRNDTSSLEAQVRGSPYAWSMRIVGIDALIKLMEVNLTTSSDEVTAKIHTILRPFEYTRIDQIVDVVFTTISDKEQQFTDETIPETLEQGTERRVQQRTPRKVIDHLKDESIARLSLREGTTIQKRRNSLYANSTDDVRAVVAVSKRYGDNGYWYAYHDETQRKYLSTAKKGYLILAMTDKDFAFAIPFVVMEAVWSELHQTVLDSGHVYKHLMTYEIGGKFILRVKNAENPLELDAYKV